MAEVGRKNVIGIAKIHPGHKHNNVFKYRGRTQLLHCIKKDEYVFLVQSGCMDTFIRIKDNFFMITV